MIHVGGRALSKRLEQFLGRSRPDPYVVVRENPFRLDPGHRVTHSVEADVVGLCAALGAAADGASVPVAANRGASGIDGTVATAAGFARGLGRPVTLLIGDLALLHDLNSLAMLRDVHVVVVVLNNDGGGIFSFLPIARHEEFFEPYFGTPQGVGFEPAAKMFGLAYEHPGTIEDFVEAYGSACARGSSTLIEIETDRGENVALHRRLLQEVADRIEKA